MKWLSDATMESARAAGYESALNRQQEATMLTVMSVSIGNTMSEKQKNKPKKIRRAEIRFIYCPICGEETKHTVTPIGESGTRRSCLTAGCPYSKDT